MSVRSPIPGPWWADSTGGGVECCAVCGDVLDDDEQVVLAVPPGPLCSDCSLSREFDQTLWEVDLADPDGGLW